APVGGIRRTVTGLLPHGDLGRVRTEDLAADLAPQEIAEHRLEPGAPVLLAVPRGSVTTYEA
ncbi:MAG: molybdenum ABC transporter ATP-binding protein, partial [Brachybacterium sp.]|nr:molybdenum ABC transporter ATP-binding protein [Brachybacterium sp.]